MKKVLTLILTLILLFAFCISASAAPAGINDAENEVLTKLKSTEVLGANGWKFAVPESYVVSAENYFNTIEMTDGQKDNIIAFIDRGIEIIKEQAEKQNFKGTTYDLRLMEVPAKQEVLQLGKDACAEVGLTLVFNSTTKKVVITDAAGIVKFSNDPIVKTTGQDFPVTMTVVTVSLAVVVICGAVILFAVSKKKGLFVR